MRVKNRNLRYEHDFAPLAPEQGGEGLPLFTRLLLYGIRATQQALSLSDRLQWSRSFGPPRRVDVEEEEEGQSVESHGHRHGPLEDWLFQDVVDVEQLHDETIDESALIWPFVSEFDGSARQHSARGLHRFHGPPRISEHTAGGSNENPFVVIDR